MTVSHTFPSHNVSPVGRDPLSRQLRHIGAGGAGGAWMSRSLRRFGDGSKLETWLTTEFSLFSTFTGSNHSGTQVRSTPIYW